MMHEEDAFRAWNALKTRYDDVEEDDLTGLYNNLTVCIDNGCGDKDPTLWYADVEWHCKEIIKASGPRKEDAELLALIKNAMKKNPLYQAKTIAIETAGKKDLNEVRKDYAKYWRTNIRKKENDEQDNIALVIDLPGARPPEGVRPPKYGHKYFSGYCGNCGVQGHKNRDCPKRGGGRNGNGGGRGGRGRGDRGKRDLSKTLCYNCQKLGHLARDCPDKKKKKEQNAFAAMFVGCVESEPARHDENASQGSSWVIIEDPVLVKKRWWADYDDSSETDEEYILSCMVDVSEDSESEDSDKTIENGMCHNCYTIGWIGNFCAKCEDMGFIYETITPELESERDRAMTVPKYTAEEKTKIIEKVGAGLCSNVQCMRVGPFNEWCPECYVPGDLDSKHLIEEEAENLNEDEGVCPVCCETGKLHDLCRECTWWFYSRIPEKWVKDHRSAACTARDEQGRRTDIDDQKQKEAETKRLSSEFASLKMKGRELKQVGSGSSKSNQSKKSEAWETLVVDAGDRIRQTKDP